MGNSDTQPANRTDFCIYRVGLTLRPKREEKWKANEMTYRSKEGKESNEEVRSIGEKK